MKILLKWGLVLVFVLSFAAYFMVSYMVASGVTKAERHPQETHPSSFNLDYEDVEFFSRGNDIVLKGWFIKAKNSLRTIIFVHGLGNVRSGDNAVELAHRLSQKGYNSLLFDLRGHGDSGGDRISGGYFEKLDALGAVDYLIQRSNSEYKIGLIGFSMGAGIGILAAEDEGLIQSLVVDTPYAKAEELVAQETARKTVFPEWFVPIFMPGIKLMAQSMYGIDLNALIPEKAVKKLEFPILVIHGELDTRIPIDHGKRVYQAANSGSSFWLVPNTEHVDSFINFPDEYVLRVTSYFDSTLLD